MGLREQPISNKMKYGKLRYYKCRKCGRSFKDYYLPEDQRFCYEHFGNRGSEHDYTFRDKDTDKLVKIRACSAELATLRAHSINNNLTFSPSR